MGKLYVVRHADAGTPGQDDGPDRLRGLSERGRRQARGLRDQLAGEGIVRLTASPSRRCVETLEPLAERLGIAVEVDDRLREGQGADGVLALAEELRGGPAAVCSHGDVIPDLLEALLQQGMKLDDELRWPKASAWVLTRGAEGFVKATYICPPR